MDATNSASTALPSEILSGLVERVPFHNAETGFCVLRVKVRGQRDLATLVGHAALVSAGEFVSASGIWVNDRTHGLHTVRGFFAGLKKKEVDVPVLERVRQVGLNKEGVKGSYTVCRVPA